MSKEFPTLISRTVEEDIHTHTHTQNNPSEAGNLWCLQLFYWDARFRQRLVLLFRRGGVIIETWLCWQERLTSGRKINSTKKSLRYRSDTGPLVFYYDACLTERTWKVLIEGYRTFIFVCVPIAFTPCGKLRKYFQMRQCVRKYVP